MISQDDPRIVDTRCDDRKITSASVCVCCVLFVVCSLLFVVCRLLFVVGCWLLVVVLVCVDCWLLFVCCVGYPTVHDDRGR